MKRFDILKILTSLGLKEYEAQIYLATLQLGTAPVARISEASGVARSFCYQAIQELVTKGLLSASKTASTQHYTAIPIDTLYQRQEEIFRSFHSALPDLRLLQNQAPPKPGVLFLTGENTIRTTLSSLPPQVPERAAVYLVWPQAQLRVTQIAEELDFSAALLARGARVTMITDREPLPEKDLTTYRFLAPGRFPLGACVVAFADQLVLLSDQTDTYSAQITGAEMARTIRSLIEAVLE